MEEFEREKVSLQEAGAPLGLPRTLLKVDKVVNGYIVEEGSYPTVLKVFYTGREVVDEVKKYFMGGEKS